MKKKKVTVKGFKKSKNAAKKEKQKVGFIGAGNMAHAMMRAFYGKWPMAVYDVDAKKTQVASDAFRAEAVSSVKELVRKSGVIIIAVKPANINEVLAEIKNSDAAGKVLISIAAGVTIGRIQEIAGLLPVVRVMPNTPVFVNEGTCAYSVSREYSGTIAAELLNLACRVAIRLDEDKMNAVTAISGSGPAYFFYMAEAMLDAGLNLGLSGEHLKDLIGQTMKGAGEMILKSKDSPSELRGKVTSKGGTTEQAIRVMEEKQMKSIIIEAVIAAKNRAEEMGK